MTALKMPYYGDYGNSSPSLIKIGQLLSCNNDVNHRIKTTKDSRRNISVHTITYEDPHYELQIKTVNDL